MAKFSVAQRPSILLTLGYTEYKRVVFRITNVYPEMQVDISSH
jgi:hypothetical protein